MNRIFSSKSLVATAIALGAVVAGSAAHARSEINVVIQPARVAYEQPYAVQYRPDSDRFDRHDRNDRHYRNDRRGGPFGDADRDGIPNMYDRDSRFFDARATYRHAQWGDLDRDGVVNQFDRAPRNPRRH